MTIRRGPGTAAGRELVQRMVDADAPSDFLSEVLAIEGEAAMNGWNLHVEQQGPPDRAAFMEGYQHAKDEAVESATVPLDVDRLTTILLNFGYDFPPAQAQRIAAAYARASAAGPVTQAQPNKDPGPIPTERP